MGLIDLFAGGQPQQGLPPDPYSQFDPLFDQASKETGVPFAILKAQAMQESSFDPSVVSKTGGIGLMQIQPSTAQQPGYGIDPLDPSKLTDPGENIRFGARYLAARAKSEGVQNWNDPQQVAKGLTAYNGGGDPNYAQNVFRYLKPPGAGEAQPAAGPVDMYGNPLPQRASATAAPQPSSQPQQTSPAEGFVSYANQSATRNKPLQPELVTAMGFLPQLGVTMRVSSGGQDGIGEGSRRTGSTRHDHGGAGDVQFMRDGKALSWENPQDVPVLQQIVRQARQNGVTGIGAGPGYMNPTTTHIGFGKAAIWGAKGGSPYAALAEAVGDVPAGAATQPAGQRNPQIARAAERGRGSLADSFTRAGTPAEGPRPMPPRRMADTTSADNGGVLEFLRQQMGQEVPMAGPQQGQGGLGGLGGFTIPGGGSYASGPAPAQSRPAAQSVESLIPAAARDPFGLIGPGAAQNIEWENKRKGDVALAKMLVEKGATPEQAVGLMNNEVALKLFLSQIGQEKTAGADRRAVGALAGTPAAVPASPSVMRDPVMEGASTTTKAQVSNVLGVLADPNVSKTVKDAAEKQYAAMLEDSKLTNEQKIHIQAKREGFGGGVLDMKERLAKAGRNETTVNVGGGSDKQVFDAFAENAKEARKAAVGLTAIREARSALQGGLIAGAGADTLLAWQKLGAAFGVGDTSKIQNTETFRAAIAPQVSAVLQATVGTTNISNTDREFAEKASGGSIALDEGSIARLLDIMEKAGSARLQLHNEQLDAVYPDPVAHKRERALFTVKTPDPAAAPAPTTAVGAPVKVFTKADWEKLPQGTKYRPPGAPADGSQDRVKP